MESLYYHALATALGGEYRTLKKKKEVHGTWASAWHAHKSAHPSLASPEELWDAFLKSGISLIMQNDTAFPSLLKEIPWQPHALYVRGTLPENEVATVAIVGTRNATPPGKAFARTLAKEIALRHIAIISGLALGIDAEAHTGALEAQGITLAVLAGGLDHVTPRTNAPIAARILSAGGALISEYPPGIPPLPHRFIERNRIVSGLSRAVLIIEAPDASGSLATARFALDQNREVLVAPGPATHPNYAGSHSLLRSGATLVTNATHVFEALGIETQSAHLPLGLSSEEACVYQALASSAHPLMIDKIIELTNLKPNDANRVTSLLLLRGIIREDGSGYTMQ